MAPVALVQVLAATGKTSTTFEQINGRKGKTFKCWFYFIVGDNFTSPITDLSRSSVATCNIKCIRLNLFGYRDVLVALIPTLTAGTSQRTEAIEQFRVVLKMVFTIHEEYQK